MTIGCHTSCLCNSFQLLYNWVSRSAAFSSCLIGLEHEMSCLSVQKLSAAAYFICYVNLAAHISVAAAMVIGLEYYENWATKL